MTFYVSSQLIEKLENVNKFKSVQFDKLRQTFQDTIDVLLTRFSKQETDREIEATKC